MRRILRIHGKIHSLLLQVYIYDNDKYLETHFELMQLNNVHETRPLKIILQMCNTVKQEKNSLFWYM